jgi:uncharacterized small protein (DUF1192 family)
MGIGGLPGKAAPVQSCRKTRGDASGRRRSGEKTCAACGGMVIDTLSIDELAARIDLLREEIKRLEAAIEARRKSLDAASSVFKF